MASIISVENLSKKYIISHRGGGMPYTALRDVLVEKCSRLIRFRRTGTSSELPRTENFWALRDVSFTVQEGEVVGIIGRNGAGKSTLLKILSRITEPTFGRVRLRGRVASLLEVGTGFHPELTGRENIHLNGAILGMSRAEIQRKFDEIVAFAEVERFLDTPVKRYSSGMYVRLAFAVAAHLEPEILIVDEVLAVGDAEFQKKCLGKMQDVSKGGRTVLFVSHNMAAVKSLTSHGIVLSGGRLAFNGTTEAAIQAYIQLPKTRNGSTVKAPWSRGVHTAILAVRLLDGNGEPTEHYAPGQTMHIEVEFETDGVPGLSLEVFLTDATRSQIGLASLQQFHDQTLPSKKGAYVCRLDLKPLWLASGSYALTVKTSVVNVRWDHSVEGALEFDVAFSSPCGNQFDFKQAYGYGSIALLASSPVRFESIAMQEDVLSSNTETVSSQ